MMRLSLFVTVLLGLGPAALAQGKYSVPAPREVTAAWEAVQDALADEDAAAAESAVRRLLDAGPGELIETGEREWIGARFAVRQLLEQDDPTTRALAARLATRREAEAREELAALASAGPRLDAAGRAALESLAWRHPGTRAHHEALLLAGDLALESGELARARTLWSDGRAYASDDDLQASYNARLTATTELHADPEAQGAPLVLDPIEGRWAQYLPPGPRDRYIDYGDLRPTALGRRVWINTGLRVMNFLATSGQLLWDSGEPDGWEALSSWKRRELFRGVALPDLTNQVATDGRIAIAALQLPFTENKNDNIDGLTITVSLPERRLFAYDAMTGAPLWDHAPSVAGRLGGALDFPERARIAGPPVIRGGLVVVPSYELVGRINLYVTAYELYTGALVWNRLIVSGQTRVNLFGEHEAEFNSAPLTIEDGRVLVCSNLGVVSALDLATGHPLWTDEYRRYELPRTNGYYTPSAQRRWHNGPPLVSGERFVIAPIDSPDLLFGAVDRGVSATLMGNDLEDLAEDGSNFGDVDLDHPVRLEGELLWIGGDALCAFNLDWQPGDVEAQLHLGPIATPGPNDAYNSPSPRARVLDAGGRFYIPTEFRLLAVDPADGAIADLGPLDSDFWQPGNLALSGGRILVLTDEFLYGWVNWDAVIAEGLARLAEDLADPERATLSVDLGRAHLARWEARGTTPSDLDAARDRLMGRRVDDWVEAGHIGALELRDLRFGLLGAEAEVAMLRSEPRRANQRLAEALAFAPTTRARIGVRFRQLEALGAPGAEEATWRTQARADVLDALLADHPREVVEPELAAELGVPYELDDLLARFHPRMTELESALGPNVLTQVPLGFLALVARAEATEATATRTSDWKRALEAWHRALWDYGDLPAPAGAPAGPELRDWLIERMAITVGTPTGRAGYASFEEAAEERIASAEARPEGERVQALAAVASRYPHSGAAQRVNRQMIDLLVEGLASAPDRDAFAQLAELALPLMDGGPEASHARLALARAAAAVGNIELAALLAERLGELDPRLAALFEPLDLAWPDAAARRSFHGPARTGHGNFSVRLGTFEPIGPFPVAPAGERAATELLLAGSSGGELLAFEAGGRGDLAWTLPLGNYANADWQDRVRSATTGEASVLCALGDNGVYGIDPHTGSLVWSAAPEGRRPRAIEVASGLLTVLWTDGDGEYVLSAHSSTDGVQLWERRLPEGLNDYKSRGEGSLLRAGTRLVVLSSESDFEPRVLDATSGAELGRLELARNTDSTDLELAWTADGHLFVPRVLGGTGDGPGVIQAYELDGPSTAPAYTLALGQNEEVAGVLHAPSGTYLWLTETERRSGAGNALVQVDTKLGALRPVAALDEGELPVGLELGEARTLETNFLMTYTPPERGGALRLRAIDLPLGTLWTANVPKPTRSSWQLDDGLLPSELVATASVALLYAQVSDDAARGQEVRVLILDRSTGKTQEDRVLSARLGRLGNIQLQGAADELFLFGGGSWGSNRGRLEVLVPQSESSR